MKKAHNIYLTLGASNHANEEREINDYYATDPKAVELLLEKEEFTKCILEPACGEGHISEALKAKGYDVVSTDLVDRGYGDRVDFFNMTKTDADIITNPPYKEALNFVKHALDIINDGRKVAFFLRVLFLEGKARGKFFKENPPKKVYVASGRLMCAKNGEFSKYKGSNAQAYAWFIWEKGYKGNTVVDWINL